MTKQYNLSLHIFRRDLRLQDNTALIDALKRSQTVIPCFIFDPKQLTHKFKSEKSIHFMANSLLELDEALRKHGSHLYCFTGAVEEVLNQLLKEINIDAVFINRDYTPYSQERDNKIAKLCTKHALALHSFADALLNEPEDVTKNDGKPYTVFTPFCRKAQTLNVQKPQPNHYKNYYNKSITAETPHPYKQLIIKQSKDFWWQGGRKEGLHLLNKIDDLKNYDTDRNLPAKVGTTYLSAHHKFGTLSIRETYQHVAEVFNRHHTLITELYWRDFFTHIGFNFPHVFDGAFHKKYDAISWRVNEKKLQAWRNGETGFPIIDAGMRQLNQTGFLHNRVRMIVASFICKDLHQNWQLGEQYFAQNLIDIDRCVNNGNWQWAASTGCDAQPYFRIFNPWLQQQKFDPDAAYIKQWVPELAALSAKKIHKLYTFQDNIGTKYSKMIIDHTEASQYAKKLYQAVV